MIHNLYFKPLIFLTFILSAEQTYAFVVPIVQCTDGPNCGWNELIETIAQIINAALLFIFPLLVILLAVGGITLIWAGFRGNIDLFNKTKSIFTRIIVGLCLVLGAFLIVKLVVNILIADEKILEHTVGKDEKSIL